MAEIPSLETKASNYYADGLRLIGCTGSTSNTWVKSFFTSNNHTHLYNFDGNVHSSFWYSTNYTGVEPWKIFLDRDGNIRLAAGSGNFDPIIEQCLGL
ncbi:hypothetical protein JW859_10290 [bacterium]|nr:hypothetical protein [bacterium]